VDTSVCTLGIIGAFIEALAFWCLYDKIRKMKEEAKQKDQTIRELHALLQFQSHNIKRA